MSNLESQRRPINPFAPGVGTLPPFLAGRQRELKSFELIVRGYPDKRQNVMIHGLRGVGKSVLLKELELELKRQSAIEWIVLRNDAEAKFIDEAVFSEWISLKLIDILERIKPSEKLRKQIKQVVGNVSYFKGSALGVSGEVGFKQPVTSASSATFATQLTQALTALSQAAAVKGMGIAILLDEAHILKDRPKKGHHPLSSLLSAVAAVQDDEENPMPLLLALCGLPNLSQNVYSAKSNAERFFKKFSVSSLPLTAEANQRVSPAAQAIVEASSDIIFTDASAEAIAKHVEGYPFFIQYYGEQLWNEAYFEDVDSVDQEFFQAHSDEIRNSLDRTFYGDRFNSMTPSKRDFIVAAASLGGEYFTVDALVSSVNKSRSNIDVMLTRLVGENIIYRTDQGVYAYTAPLFGDYIRRTQFRLNS